MLIPMRDQWFRRFGWIFSPVSWQGWFALLLCLLFCIQAVSVESYGASSSIAAVFGAFPFIVSTFGILFWIASKTSDSKGL